MYIEVNGLRIGLFIQASSRVQAIVCRALFYRNAFPSDSNAIELPSIREIYSECGRSVASTIDFALFLTYKIGAFDGSPIDASDFDFLVRLQRMKNFQMLSISKSFWMAHGLSTRLKSLQQDACLISLAP